MTESSKPEKLFSEFSKSTREEWIRTIEADLHGKSLESITRHTFEGFPVPPVFTSADMTGLEYLNTLPGEYPFSRGINHEKNQWSIRQDIDIETAIDSGTHAKNALLKGAQEIGFNFKPFQKITPSIFESLLKDMQNHDHPVYFHMPVPDCLHDIRALTAALRNLQLDPKIFRGGFETDPLYQYLVSDRSVSPEDIQNTIRYLLKTHEQELPNFKMLMINGHGFGDLTTSITHELAFSLAAGTEYLSWILSSNGNRSFPQNFMGFTMGIGPNFFMEIAKIRALRLLWSRIVSSFDERFLSGGMVCINSRSCSWNKTKYDSHVNILRYTAEALSAALGGANSICTYPFDHPLGTGSLLAERIARNAQILFKEESHLEHVCDPAGGSYYIENLTHTIAEHAWQLFQDIEQQGGFLKSIQSGHIRETITKLQSQRDVEIFNRKTVLLGTNHYPNQNELYRDLHSQGVKQKSPETTPDPSGFQKPYRGAERFEILRKKTEERTGGRPEVVLFPFGHPAKRAARITFISNFMGSGGFQIHDLTGMASLEEGIRFCLKKKPEIIVFCSSDEEYPEVLPGIVDKLRIHPVLIVAGHPEKQTDALKKMGIRFFIHQKSDVFMTLQSIQQSIGIK